MNIQFENKSVLITGASRGIGRATARMFAGAGAKVALHYNRNTAEAEKTLESLDGHGHILVQGDIANPDEVKKIADNAIEKLGSIDVLVNNAGIYEEIDFVTLDYKQWQETWRRTLDVNLNGVSSLSFLIARHMIFHGGGRIVNVSSRGAFRGEPTAPAYGAAKAGLNALGQSMARALAPYHVFVYTVAPGWVDTDMAAEGLKGPHGDEVRRQSPLNRVATPEEIARAILFLASEGNDYMTGCIVDINGASYLRS